MIFFIFHTYVVIIIQFHYEAPIRGPWRKSSLIRNKREKLPDLYPLQLHRSTLVRLKSHWFRYSVWVAIVRIGDAGGAPCKLKISNPSRLALFPWYLSLSWFLQFLSLPTSFLRPSDPLFFLFPTFTLFYLFIYLLFRSFRSVSGYAFHLGHCGACRRLCGSSHGLWNWC